MPQEPLGNGTTTVVSYLNTLNFTYNFGILIAHFTSIVLFSRILYSAHFNPQALRISALSKLLYMFLVTHIVLVLATIPYHIYLLLKWTSLANTANYDPYVLLYLGVWVDSYINASSAVAYFIMMDRWIALKFPFKYNTFISTWLLKIAILSGIIVCSASIVYGIIEIPLDMDKVRNCQAFGCVQIRYHHWLPINIKLLFSALNAIFGAHFIYLIRSTTIHTKSRIVRITMVMEIVLNAVPSICAQLFFFATNANLGNYWGQMTTLLNAVYVALCSIFYWKILAKKASTGDYGVVIGWEFQSLIVIIFTFYWQRIGAIEFINNEILTCDSTSNKSKHSKCLRIKRRVIMWFIVMLFVTLFGMARFIGSQINKSILRGRKITDPTMGLHSFDFVYRIIALYQLLLTNLAVSFFATSVQCLTIQLQEFNRAYQEVFVFCMLVTGVPMTVFGTITFVPRDNWISSILTFYDLLFCGFQLVSFTVVPAHLHSELQAIPSLIHWSTALTAQCDSQLLQTVRNFTENVQQFRVGLSFGGLVTIKKSSISMAFVLIVPYVILSYQLYVESSKYSHNYNIVTRTLNRTV